MSLKGTKEFTVASSLSKALDNLELNTIADAFKDNGITLSTNSEKVLLSVSKHNDHNKESSWHLIDMGNQMASYELSQERDNIRVRTEPQLYFALQDTQIGTLPLFTAGIRVSSAIEFFAFKQKTDIVVDMPTVNVMGGNPIPSKGIYVSTEMGAIVFGSKEFCSITNYTDDGGPLLSIATFSAERSKYKKLFNDPHFFISGKMSLLGLTSEVYANVTESGIELAFKRKEFGADFDIYAMFDSPTNFDGKGTFSFGINTKIKIAKIGTVKINTTLDGSLDSGFKNGSAYARCSGEFTFQGKKFRIGSFAISCNEESLKELYDLFLPKIMKSIEDFLLNDVEGWANWVGEQIIDVADDAADLFRNTFNLPYGEMAEFMNSMGQTGASVAAGLSSTYNLLAHQSANAMQAAHYTADQIASGMNSAYNFSANQTAALLNGAGYTADQITGGLMSAYDYTEEQAKETLRQAEQGINTIGNTMGDIADTLDPRGWF